MVLRSTIALAIANALIPLSILIFATGFFPRKPYLPGLASYEQLTLGPVPAAPFDRLIFMLVDALRSDFVYSSESGFKFTQSLIRDGAAIPFTAYARPPTVTMPRIKAMTTGSIPSFVDLILNLGEADTSSALSTHDTWVAQLKAAEKGKLLMYGDNTWLKLFPETFDRHDGTSSFFVADFTEVDRNVTRNIPDELERSDWALMVLHYLGLDHIGHKAGPRSSHMLPKQVEMDEIVETIYTAMATKDHLNSTMLVLCGDHGMNDAGNHGASSAGETSPALVFISPKLKTISKKLPAPIQSKGEFDYYSKVEQSDIAPTIAALLGFPISKNNLGVFIPDFFPFWPKFSDRAQILIRNARQILDIMDAAFGDDLFNLEERERADPCALEATQINELACEWRRIEKQAALLSSAKQMDLMWLTTISTWLQKVQDLMSSMTSKYDMKRIMIGQGVAIGAVIFSLAAVALQNIHRSTPFFLFFLLTSLYSIMMFASSYVEEEQHFWYWTTTIWMVWLGSCAVYRTGRPSAAAWHLFSVGAFRLARSWNQTGQKFAGAPDIVKLFLIPNPQITWALVTFTYLVVLIRLLFGISSRHKVITTTLVSLLVTIAFTFKLASTAFDAPELVTGLFRKLIDISGSQSLTSRARVIFALLAMLAALAVYQGSKTRHYAASSTRLLHHLYTLLAMTQSRAINIPLFILASVAGQCLELDELSVTDVTISAILLQHMFFFAFGGSNAISSVDLSNAYNGINDFNVIAVGILTFLGNWAGPLFWTSATNLLLLPKHCEGQENVYRHHLTLLTLFVTASIAFVIAACTMLRTHLFIWTVFSPKCLYSMVWSLGQHLAVNLGLGGLLFFFGVR